MIKIGSIVRILKSPYNKIQPIAVVNGFIKGAGIYCDCWCVAGLYWGIMFAENELQLICE